MSHEMKKSHCDFPHVSLDHMGQGIWFLCTHTASLLTCIGEDSEILIEAGVVVASQVTWLHVGAVGELDGLAVARQGAG